MFTFNKTGHNVCKMVGGRRRGRVYIDEKKRGYKQMDLKGSKFEIVPSKHKRDVIYITAPSGCGKSFFCSIYARNYKKMFKRNKIYIFSRVRDAPSYKHYVLSY